MKIREFMLLVHFRLRISGRQSIWYLPVHIAKFYGFIFIKPFTRLKNQTQDCTAVLHLMYAVIRRLKATTTIRSIYIESDKKAEIFTEMNDFLEQSHKRYNIQVHQTSGGIKEALGKEF